MYVLSSLYVIFDYCSCFVLAQRITTSKRDILMGGDLVGINQEPLQFALKFAMEKLKKVESGKSLVNNG